MTATAYEHQTYRRAVDLVARRENIPAAAVISPRGWAQRRVRAIAVYLTAVAANCGAKPTARVCGLHEAGVRYVLRAIEDQRDDPDVDRQLTELEEMMACS